MNKQTILLLAGAKDAHRTGMKLLIAGFKDHAKQAFALRDSQMVQVRQIH